MVGRAEFFRRQAKHKQQLINEPPKQKLNDDVWFSKGLEACRDLSSMTDNAWGKVGFSEMMGVSHEEAERRLRVLTRAGFLHMGTEKAPDGDFIRYVWSLRNTSLPRKLGEESE